MVLQLSNLEVVDKEVEGVDELLPELIQSLILDSDYKIGTTFARVFKSLSDSLGCLVLVAPDEMVSGVKLFVGSYGQSEFFKKFSEFYSSIAFENNFDSVGSFLKEYGVDISEQRTHVFESVAEKRLIYFKPLIEDDGRHVGLIAFEVSDGSEPLISNIFRAAVTSLVNRTNTNKFLGVKFPPVSEVVSGLTHDLRGGLALIGMQNELSRFQGSSPSELGLARERISSGIATVELASERLQGFIELLFPPFYASNNCSPLSALYAATASLPWSQEVKSLIKTEIDPAVSRARIDLSGATVYWVFRTIISFMSDPRRLNKAMSRVDVKLGLDEVTNASVFLRCEMPMPAPDSGSDKKQVKKIDEQTEGLVVMRRATAFALWASRIGFKLNLKTENGRLTYEISFKKFV